jgi:hypothetical protein
VGSGHDENFDHTRIKQTNSARGKQDGASGLSTKITDQSLDKIGQYAHAEEEILDNVGTMIQMTLQSGESTVTSTSYAGQSHQLRENIAGDAMEQAFEHRADVLVSSPETVQAFADAERAWAAKMEENRQRWIAEDRERAQAKAEYEAQREADAKAAAERREAEERAEEAEERRDDARERRRQDAYMRQMYPWLFPPRNNSYKSQPPDTFSGALNWSNYFPTPSGQSDVAVTPWLNTTSSQPASTTTVPKTTASDCHSDGCIIH